MLVVWGWGGGSTVQTSKPNNEVKAASQRLVELSDESFYSVSVSTVLLNGALNYRLDRSRLIMIFVFFVIAMLHLISKEDLTLELPRQMRNNTVLCHITTFCQGFKLYSGVSITIVSFVHLCQFCEPSCS